MKLVQTISTQRFKVQSQNLLKQKNCQWELFTCITFYFFSLRFLHIAKNSQTAKTSNIECKQTTNSPILFVSLRFFIYFFYKSIFYYSASTNIVTGHVEQYVNKEKLDVHLIFAISSSFLLLFAQWYFIEWSSEMPADRKREKKNTNDHKDKSKKKMEEANIEVSKTCSTCWS